MTTAPSTGIDALRSMRNDRRKRRVQDMEWFDTLYRVYLAALIGGGAVIFLSSLVKDDAFRGQELLDVVNNFPRVAGLVMAVVVWLGMRGGANGGPLSLEEAEVRHVLLAPVDRARVLRHPAIQRMRTLAFSGAIAGAATGLVIGKRMPPSWGTGTAGFVSLGAVGGAMIGASFVVSALLVHALRINRSIVTLTAAALVAWQGATVFLPSHPHGPFTAFGLIAFAHIDPSPVIGAVVFVVLTALALARTGNLRIEALARRSALVSQLKFAVTLQDIRTVVLLRRQLSQEHMREKPWFKAPSALRRDPVITRCLRSVAHFPLRRLARMALLATVAAVAQVAVWNGTTPGVVVSGLALFLLGLDVIEPLSQEVDQPDRTDSLPLERGLLLAKHLTVPALVTLPFALIGAAVAYALEPHGMTIVAGALIGVPAVLAGLAGAVINAVKGAPDPASEANSGLFMPPEVSGMTTVIRAVWPPVVSIIGSIPTVALVRAVDNGQNLPGTMARTALGVLSVCFLTAGWVRQRDHIRAWFRNATKPPSSGSTNSSFSSAQKAG